jgi:hypothetical protein
MIKVAFLSMVRVCWLLPVQGRPGNQTVQSQLDWYIWDLDRYIIYIYITIYIWDILTGP